MFWDKLKATQKEPRPTAVEVSRDGELLVSWDDGKQSRWPAAELRLACPCAACIDEWTGERKIDASRIAADIRPLAVEPVGNYAVQIRWSDGHETGIYPWRLLRPPT
jgi:DUF971 family protein